MIVVRLWGGLGNQLFQYAYAYSVARRNNEKLILDKRFYSSEYLENNMRFTKQLFQLDNLNINFMDEVNNLQLNMKLVKVMQNKYINRIIRVFNNKGYGFGDGLKYLKEARFKYNPYYINPKGSTSVLYLDGYWQCEKYFLEYKDELINQFIINNSQIEEECIKYMGDNKTYISVHVRRGDYTRNRNIFSNLYLLEKAYYREAMEYFESKFDNVRFLFFTNDIDWVKNNISLKHDFVIVNEERKFSDLIEFQLMCRCTHNVISNSTFSWWAAWLNLNDKKTVIGPKQWFGNRDIMPKQWKAI